MASFHELPIASVQTRSTSKRSHPSPPMAGQTPGRPPKKLVSEQKTASAKTASQARSTSAKFSREQDSSAKNRAGAPPAGAPHAIDSPPAKPKRDRLPEGSYCDLLSDDSSEDSSADSSDEDHAGAPPISAP